jgi:hypothetical protein
MSSHQYDSKIDRICSGLKRSLVWVFRLGADGLCRFAAKDSQAPLGQTEFGRVFHKTDVITSDI